MVNDKQRISGLPWSALANALVAHHHGAGDHVMKAAFAFGKSDHEEADTEKHGRKDLGKEPSCSTAETNPVAGFISHLKPQNAFPDGSLPCGTGQQGFIKPLAGECDHHIKGD